MTMDMLQFAIAAFCQFKDPKVNKEQKIACAEMLVNCAIVEDGKTTTKQFEMCREKWLAQKS